LKISEFGGNIPICTLMKITGPPRSLVASRASLAALCVAAALFAVAEPSLFEVLARQIDSAKPAVVQPGAPGEPSKRLPDSTKGTLPPKSRADVSFMQGMIMHHAQAVEMTALISSHTRNKDLQALGARINASQTDEIKFMKRWLSARGESTSMQAGEMAGMSHGDINDAHGANQSMPLMPGMLTPQQMGALGKARGAEFDKLFLTGMVQHHNGALAMVKDLFDTAGAGQDGEIFGFATDVDTGQRAEIKIMQEMLEKKSEEGKT
jgi:uncharacterized protein (DUF305 family)